MQPLLQTPLNKSVKYKWYGLFIVFIFFVSGFPALLYQLLWQRVLFSVFGVNIESVTIVATIFISGLGIGGFIGGLLSKKFSAHLLLLFGLIEILIAILGFYSLDLIQLVSSDISSLTLLKTSLYTAGLLFIPTLLMGASFPLLTTQLTQWSGQTGVSAGMLYFANTLGSAVACFMAASFLFKAMGQQGSINIAVFLNLLVAFIAMLLAYIASKNSSTVSIKKPLQDTVISENNKAIRTSISFNSALFSAAIMGFLALSYEIVWVRIYYFSSQGTASSYALLLGSYLVGIALGALYGQHLCVNSISLDKLKNKFFYGIFLATLLAFVLPPLVSYMIASMDYWFTLPLVSLVMLIFGTLFPILIHLSIDANKDTGFYTGLIYLANVLGGSLGALLIGFVLMDCVPLKYISLGLGLSGLVVAFVMINDHKAKLMRTLVLVVVGFIFVIATEPLYEHFYERLLTKKQFKQGNSFVHLIENRSGVIAVTKSDRVYGNGAYDGVFNTDLSKKKNGIIRAYAVGLIHPKPRRVVMIGLASGSWAQVVAHNPDVEELIIIEINPGYVELIKRSPVTSSLLSNPKVKIIIDDGRRWLRNLKEKNSIDLIIMNTIHNWRSGATNLISSEFILNAKKYLAEDGVFYFNSTRSKRAQRTGLINYQYGLRIHGLIALSDSPININKASWREHLINFRIDGEKVLNLDKDSDLLALNKAMLLVDSLNSKPQRHGMESRASLLDRTEGTKIITMDNMGKEWYRF